MKKIFKRGMSGLPLQSLWHSPCLRALARHTAFAASETAESYMISFPRDGTLRSDLPGGRMGTLREKLYERLGNRLQQLGDPALHGFL